MLARYTAHAPLVIRVAALTALLAGLSQLVIYAQAFSHDDRWLKLLADHAVAAWLLYGAWLGLMLLRLRTAREATLALFSSRWLYGGLLAATGIAWVSSFMNAYFTHVTHPVLAAWIAWTVWPWLTALGDRVARLQLTVPSRLTPWLGATAAATLVFVQAYRRHLWFGSGSKDLGLFHQSVWLLSRFESPDNTVMGMNAFADHMEFVDILAAPLQWLWPDAGALLLFQSVVVALGVVPVIWLARARLGWEPAAWVMAGAYLLGIDMQHAVMFDFNPTTVAAGLLPWVAYAFDRERPLAFGVALGLVALCKENLVLYALALCMALAIGAAPKQRRRALAAAAALAVLFVVEMKVLFPLFRSEGFRHLRFAQLGATPLEMAGSVAASPWRALAVLFTPGNKIDGLLAPFSTVAFVVWLAPRYLLALAPALLERFWSSHANRWWGHHYGAGLAALVVIGAIEGLGRLRHELGAERWARLRVPLLVAVLLSALLVSGAGRFGPGPLWVWRAGYYASSEVRANAQRALEIIPSDAAVAAQNHLLSHLSARRSIFMLDKPVVAEWVAIDLAQDAWPYRRNYPYRLALELRAKGYGVVACEGSAVVLRRGQGQTSLRCAALERE